MINFCIIAIILLVYIIAGFGIWTVNKIRIDKTESTTIEKKNVLYNTTLKYEDDIKILDDIIDDEFTQYQIMYLAYQPDLYINPDIQKKIISEILESVLLKISDDLLDRLSLYYKKEYLGDIIFNKIKLVVINYTIEVNGNYKK